MPLDPTQEPIFPPELLVGDAPGRGPAKEPVETHIIIPVGTLVSLPFGFSFLPLTPEVKSLCHMLPKGPTLLAQRRGSLQHPV